MWENRCRQERLRGQCHGGTGRYLQRKMHLSGQGQASSSVKPCPPVWHPLYSPIDVFFDLQEQRPESMNHLLEKQASASLATGVRMGKSVHSQPQLPVGCARTVGLRSIKPSEQVEGVWGASSGPLFLIPQHTALACKTMSLKVWILRRFHLPVELVLQ